LICNLLTVSQRHGCGQDDARDGLQCGGVLFESPGQRTGKRAPPRCIHDVELPIVVATRVEQRREQGVLIAARAVDPRSRLVG
jgi:hypothetical protein